MKNENEIVLFESKDGKVTLPVSVDVDTVWLNMAQMATLFCKDRSVILRHIHNAIKEGEIDQKVTCAKFAQVTPLVLILNRSWMLRNDVLEMNGQNSSKLWKKSTRNLPALRFWYNVCNHC